MAERYSGLPHFFAIDLKNEPHGAATWGTGNPATDWKLAAEKAGRAVLAANPTLLIFVEGVQENPVCSDGTNHWWGGNLEPQACYPIDLPADKLVLSPHVYGPDVHGQPYFDDPAFPANMPAIWEEHFGQFAPTHAVIIGEFGGRYGHGGDPKDKVWQDALVDYLIGKGMRSAFYWSWNPNSGDTGGILQDDWTSVWTDKVELLERLWGDGPPATPVPTNTPTASPTEIPTEMPTGMPTGVPTDTPTNMPTATPTFTPSTTPLPSQTPTPTTPPTTVPTSSPGVGACTVDYAIHSDWGNGFVTTVALTNSGSGPWNGWTASWRFGGNQQITNLWNGTVGQDGQAVAVDNAPWNGTVVPGVSVHFGFVAAYSDSNPVPAPISVNGVVCTPRATGAADQSDVALLAAGESAQLALTGESDVRVEIPGAAIREPAVMVLLRSEPPPRLGAGHHALGGYLRLIAARRDDATLFAPAAAYTLSVQPAAEVADPDGTAILRWNDGGAAWETLPTTPIGGTALLAAPTFTAQEVRTGLFALTARDDGANIFLPLVMQ